MTQQAKTVLEQFPVRKSAKQKAQFRDWLCSELLRRGSVRLLGEAEEKRSAAT